MVKSCCLAYISRRENVLAVTVSHCVTEEKRLSNVNKNSYKPPVAEYVKDIVRKNFTHEIEFYEFCKQRLHQQYLALGLPEN